MGKPDSCYENFSQTRTPYFLILDSEYNNYVQCVHDNKAFAHGAAAAFVTSCLILQRGNASPQLAETTPAPLEWAERFDIKTGAHSSFNCPIS